MATIKTSMPGAGVYLVYTDLFLKQNGVKDFELVKAEYGVTTFLEINMSDEDATMLHLKYGDIGETISETIANLFQTF